jgi:hypothetical protein
VPVLGARSRGLPRGGEQRRLTQRLAAGMCVFGACIASGGLAQEPDAPSDPCRRPQPGSAVAQPQDLRSADGILKVDLALYDSKQPDDSTHYCYLTPEGAPSPTLRVKPGDLLILRLRNKLVDFAQETASGCDARMVNVEFAKKRDAAKADTAGPSLCLYRGPMAVHLEVRQSSIAAILAALAGAYKISYRSAVPLTELRSGKYAGALQSVIAEVLDSYDYAIVHENSNIDVMVFDKSGGQSVPAAQPVSAPTKTTADQTRPSVARVH